ncbi:D-ribose-binding periplasmic protein precursor [Marinomonas spartinae]|uniref:D-ribose-binding periplasmic protein n=1 Tax=Marinomonas spartinae TaxID=1792290 RepID=A0A1A8TVY1_9GAMM|nr:sugar ABC transporter substrate-binding protein [Marinomonas spartinae]SBS29217.1 D-ribose-binding periplasmic protein precursor [Marinomonas spartinae]SBS37623.1 D-ribose-binding periplasmic protein precursor [Marinomonas spartinae]
MKFPYRKLACLVAAGSLSTVALADEPIIGLITKTNTNPYFVTMKQGAQKEAKKLGVDLRTFAGRYDGDNQSQVDAVENLIAAGAKGILITPSDPAAIVPTIEKARKAGLLVIALDTKLNPANAADMTFATNNFQAGELIGEWAKAKMGAKAKDAKIAMLDLSTSQVTVDVARDQGFLKGFGIDIKNPNRIGDETDPRIVGHDVTQGSAEGGRRAMENLLQKDPSINLVYTINEPAAAGAYQALKSFGLEKKVMIVSIDGGCPGVKNIQEGILDATAMQFPIKMAIDGVDAISQFAKTGTRPTATKGLDYFNTGVQLITNEPVKGVKSVTTKTGLAMCWG